MYETQLDDIMAALGVTTPEEAVELVRQLASRPAPLLSVERDGTLQVATGVTVGQALRLLASAQARIEGMVIRE